MKTNKIILALALCSALCVTAQAQYTSSIATYPGTLLKDSNGNAWSDYTLQFGVFTSTMPLDGGFWFNWDSSSSSTNIGFTQLGRTTGTAGTGGLLSLDSNDYIATFANTGRPYTDVMGQSPTAIFTRAASGAVREVLVAKFTSGLVGWDPDGIETQNILGLVNEADQTIFTPYTGGASGSGATTVLTSASVPEPSTLSLLVGGACALLALRKRKV